MKYALLTVLSLIALASQVACGPAVRGGPGASAAVAAATATSPQSGDGLPGRWAGGCFPSGTASLSETLAFTGNRADLQVAIYSDSSCQQLVAQEEQSGSYQLSALPGLASGFEAIDYHVEHEVLTFSDLTWLQNISSLAASSDCDLEPFKFKLAVPQDLASQDRCLQQRLVSQSRYSVVKVDGQQLFVGDGDTTGADAGQSASTRITVLELAHPFYRE